MSNYSIKEGANNPSLVVFLFDKYGTPQQTPLLGLDETERITFIFRKADKTATAAADLIADGENWIDPEDPETYQHAAQYLWQEGETADLAAGDVNFEVEVEWTTGQIEKIPNTGYFMFTITSDLRGSATET